ncbi:Uncharacterised protein [Salmonella enterica subsp. enterica serovar Bovismorbificans]|uniref:Uncharacterized protein n=1 Tax=Salmonella enterica subsp. enterica serovar Bovismorbificans TaxID=58097 RepID=A0A655DHF0_SALET|nr:Uncharacterised protein [Salmonella enterica subsp. enterica serovar Bovismorbificans]
MAIVQSPNPDVLRLQHGEIHVGAPGRIRIVYRVALRIAPGWHQPPSRAGSADHHARVEQHGGVGDVPLGKVVETPAQVNRPLPTAGKVPVTRHGKRGRVLLRIIQIGTFKAALYQIVLLQRVFQQRHFITKIQHLFRRRNTGAGGQAMTVRVHPRFFPRRFHARPDVSGVPHPSFNRVFGSRRYHAF